VPQGMNPSYAVTARVYYEYRTDVIKSFTIYPSSELLALNQQGKPIPSSTVSSTQSPISITAEAREPIRFWEGGQISFPLSITVANTGGGTVCLTGRCKRSEGADWNELNLVIIPVSAGLSVSSECAEYEGGAFSPGEAISVSGLALSGGILEVWPNRPNTIICDIIVSGLGASTEEKTLQVSAEYSYFTDAKSSITII
jgi:hypothetical protein